MPVTKPVTVPRWATVPAIPSQIVTPPDNFGAIPAWAAGPFAVGATVTKTGNEYIVTAIAGTGTSTTGPTGTGTTVDNPGANQVTWQFVTATPITKDSGWQPGVQPPAQYFNWFWNLVYLWILWLQDIANQNFSSTGVNPYGPWANRHKFIGDGTINPPILVTASGNASAPGIQSLGATGVGGTGVGGDGIDCYGGVCSGGGSSTGVNGTGNGAAGIGLNGTGAGTGPGVSGQGGTIEGVGGNFQGGTAVTGGTGVVASGGSGGTGCDGLHANAGGTNGNGAVCTATGNGSGVQGIATGSGPGVAGVNVGGTGSSGEFDSSAGSGFAVRAIGPNGAISIYSTATGNGQAYNGFGTSTDAIAHFENDGTGFAVLAIGGGANAGAIKADASAQSTGYAILAHGSASTFPTISAAAKAASNAGALQGQGDGSGYGVKGIMAGTTGPALWGQGSYLLLDTDIAQNTALPAGEQYRNQIVKAAGKVTVPGGGGMTWVVDPTRGFNIASATVNAGDHTRLDITHNTPVTGVPQVSIYAALFGAVHSFSLYIENDANPISIRVYDNTAAAYIDFSLGGLALTGFMVTVN